MEILIFLICVVFVIFYLFRPTSKNEKDQFDDKNNQIIVINEIVIEERIRDLVFKNNKIFIYQETTGIIGIIDLET